MPLKSILRSTNAGWPSGLSLPVMETGATPSTLPRRSTSARPSASEERPVMEPVKSLMPPRAAGLTERSSKRNAVRSKAKRPTVTAIGKGAGAAEVATDPGEWSAATEADSMLADAAWAMLSVPSASTRTVALGSTKRISSAWKASGAVAAFIPVMEKSVHFTKSWASLPSTVRKSARPKSPENDASPSRSTALPFMRMAPPASRMLRKGST